MTSQLEILDYFKDCYIEYYYTLIHYDQIAFDSNRYIGEHISFTSDIMEHLDQKNGGFFAADLAAAFDFKGYAFFFETLNNLKIRIPFSFIKWIKLLHTDLKCCVMINGSSISLVLIPPYFHALFYYLVE